MRRTFTLGVLLGSITLSAQSNIPDSLVLRLRSWYDITATPDAPWADTAAFNRFREAMDTAGLSKEAPHPAEAYRLVWVEHREGHRYTLLPGDGRTLAAVLQKPPVPGFGWPLFPAYHGDRYAVFGDSPPTGLIRYEYWYFERVE